MSDLLTTLPAYAAPLAYLLMVCALLAATGSCPSWVHPIALALGLPVRVLLAGWSETLVNASVGAVFFVVLVYFAGRSVSGVTLFSLVTTLALVPVEAWPGIALALLAVTIVAVKRTISGHGKDRVTWLVLDTMEGMGVRPGRGIGMPSADLVPTKEAVATATRNAESSGEGASSSLSAPIFLPPYLLGGVTLAVLMSAFLA